MKITKNVSEPRESGGSVSKLMVFRFYARARDPYLFLRTPRNEIAANEDTVASGGSSIIWVANVISVDIRSKDEGTSSVDKAIIMCCF